MMQLLLSRTLKRSAGQAVGDYANRKPNIAAVGIISKRVLPVHIFSVQEADVAIAADGEIERFVAVEYACRFVIYLTACGHEAR